MTESKEDVKRIEKLDLEENYGPALDNFGRVRRNKLSNLYGEVSDRRGYKRPCSD